MFDKIDSSRMNLFCSAILYYERCEDQDSDCPQKDYFLDLNCLFGCEGPKN
jgi:hypothetical protein